MKHSAKAQFEAMGLAVIVVLISLGMFFMLFFSLNRPSDFPASYNREQATQNFVDAFIKTNAAPNGRPCGPTMEDLILDLINSRNPCFGQSSQEVLETSSEYMLNNTFGDAVPYEFTITISGETSPRVIHSTCPTSAALRDKPGVQDLPLLPTSRVATVQLVWCLE